MKRINNLLEHSHLPGPRGNLELLYEFSRDARKDEIETCLSYISPDVRNSPEEFVGMCGILSYSIHHQKEIQKVLSFLKEYTGHDSWRIREAVAMSIQEISEKNLEKVLTGLDDFIHGHDFEKRAVVAGLCEPKLLTDQKTNLQILDILYRISQTIDHDDKLDEGATSLRKALGYGWSVVICAIPDEGKQLFEKMFDWSGKHIQWILKENLKKNRLQKLDPDWVNECSKKLY